MCYFQVWKSVNNQLFKKGGEIYVLLCLIHFSWEGMEWGEIKNSVKNPCQGLCLEMGWITQTLQFKRGKGRARCLLF